METSEGHLGKGLFFSPAEKVKEAEKEWMEK